MKMQIQPSQFIMAAFCYVMAAMIWKVGYALVYYGQTESWFVMFIWALFVTSGLCFQFDNIVKG